MLFALGDRARSLPAVGKKQEARSKKQEAKKMKLTNISVFPIKSAKGFSLENTIIENMGIPYDRSFAIIGADDKIITARENPLLLTIQTKIENGQIELSSAGKESIHLVLDELPQNNSISVGIFSDFTNAIPINHPVNDWLSSILQQPVKLVKTDPGSLRKMKEKYAPTNQEVIRFCDLAPIHLISKSSLDDLNLKLDQPVTATRFRPNFLIDGAEPYAEDHWKSIQIGDFVFDVGMKTMRCNLLTIHPETAERNPNQEPLRTLSKIKKNGNEVSFGIYLIPRKLGVVKKGDTVTILELQTG